MEARAGEAIKKISTASSNKAAIDAYEKEMESKVRATEILINSIIFMLAGYDTTAAGISWVFYKLALNPEIQEKLANVIEDEIGEYRINKGSELNVSRNTGSTKEASLRCHYHAVRTDWRAM
ncbi:hypothetical protein DPMN_134762, partial [Dreissena polymorpha]